MNEFVRRRRQQVDLGIDRLGSSRASAVPRNKINIVAPSSRAALLLLETDPHVQRAMAAQAVASPLTSNLPRHVALHIVLGDNAFNSDIAACVDDGRPLCRHQRALKSSPRQASSRVSVAYYRPASARLAAAGVSTMKMERNLASIILGQCRPSLRPSLASCRIFPRVYGHEHFDMAS